MQDSKPPNESLPSANGSLAKPLAIKRKSKISDQRLAQEIGNSVLQISTIFCSSRPTLLPTGGIDGTNFSIRKLHGVATLSGCGRSHTRTKLLPKFPGNREIHGIMAQTPQVFWRRSPDMSEVDLE
jgi:hypothetical protein